MFNLSKNIYIILIFTCKQHVISFYLMPIQQNCIIMFNIFHFSQHILVIPDIEYVFKYLVLKGDIHMYTNTANCKSLEELLQYISLKTQKWLQTHTTKHTRLYSSNVAVSNTMKSNCNALWKTNTCRKRCSLASAGPVHSSLSSQTFKHSSSPFLCTQWTE